DSYEPMQRALEVPKEKERTYSGDHEGIDRAAADLDKKRGEQEQPIVREYVKYEDGAPTTERMAPNLTVTAEQAADDLKFQREQEAQGAALVEDIATGIQTDALRAGQTPTDYVENLLAQLQQQAAIEPQPTTELPDGVDPEIVEALQKSPKLRAALEQEAARVQQVNQAAEQARQQYVQAVQQAHNVALNFTIGQFPELRGLTVEQIPAALKVLEQSNPQRYTQVVTHLAHLDTVAKANAQVQAQQQGQVQANVQRWGREQDAQMDAWLAKAEKPETVRQVKESLPRILKDLYGIEPTALSQALQSTPALRSFEFQRLLYDATRFHLAQNGISEKQYTPVPPVQRPGVSQPTASRSDAEVSAARARFEKNPDDLKAAADFILAKRAARS